MRLTLRVRTVWILRPFLAAKMHVAVKMLRLMDERRIFTDVVIDWGVIEGVLRGDYFSPYGLAVGVRDDVLLKSGVDIDSLDEHVERGLRKYLDKKQLVARGSRLVFGLRGNFFGYPVAGMLYVRGSGSERRVYGDVELILYSNKLRLNDMFEFYKYLVKEHGGKDVGNKFVNISQELFNWKPKDVAVKEVFIQHREGDVKYDMNLMSFAAHRDPRSHFALVVRFLKKRRKIGEASAVEKEVLRKISGYLNPSTIYNKVYRKEEFLRNTERAYSDTGYLVSRGSFIVAATEQYDLMKGYYSYLDKVLSRLMMKFPSEDQYDLWLMEGLRSLSAGR